MRSLLDRLRHALIFEILALVLVIPLGAMVFGFPMEDFGVVGVVCATIAMIWNFIFNYAFDRALKYFIATTQKTGLMRILHAVLFEIGMLIILIPFIAWFLEIPLWQALVMDVALSIFYLVYALVFNWAYDKIFPLPEWKQPLASK